MFFKPDEDTGVSPMVNADFKTCKNCFQNLSFTGLAVWESSKLTVLSLYPRQLRR